MKKLMITTMLLGSMAQNAFAQKIEHLTWFGEEYITGSCQVCPVTDSEFSFTLITTLDKRDYPK